MLRIVPNRKGSTSVVYVNEALGMASKIVSAFHEFGVVEREVFWLRLLGDLRWFPSLLAVDGNKIAMTYEGEPVTYETLPPSWLDQAEAVLTALGSRHCAHNDIKPHDVLVRDGELRLVDFQWATVIGAEVPAEWPKTIGMGYRGTQGFSDRHSLMMVLDEVSSEPE